MSTTALQALKCKFTCSLEDASDIQHVGNKAHNLHRIVRLGLQVPPAFVITHAAFQLFCETKSDAIPLKVLEEVLEMRRMLLPPGPMVIRSSAVGEDGVTASFAGQLDSILHVETDDEIRRALHACWLSYWSDRVVAYQRLKGVRLRGMGVIVQLQARSAFSGVMFTRTPGSIAPDDICIEYCRGFGDELVSGRITPERFRIRRNDGHIVEDEPADRVVFDEQRIRHLKQSAEILESHFGGPQDIEWTIDDDGELFLLQSRPITTFAAKRADPILWSNANINENFPGPITPFLYSIVREGYYHYFRNLAIAFGLSPRRVRAMENSLRHIVGVHHTRLYYNLTSIHSVLRMAPFGEKLADFFNDFVGADAKSPRIDDNATPRWLQALEVCRSIVKTCRQYAFLTRRIQEFEQTVDTFADATLPQDLERRSMLQLRDDLRSFMEIRCHRWTNASLADAGAMVCYGVLKALSRRAYPSEEDAAVHNNLLKRVGGVISVQPALELEKLARKIAADAETASWFIAADSPTILSDTEPHREWLRLDLADYIHQWGFRFSGELMLTVPGFEEDPAPLIDLLQAYVKTGGGSPATGSDATEPAHCRSVYKSLLVRFILPATQKAIQLRERARLKQAMLYSRCRRIALAIGKQLTGDGVLRASEDVFFLTYLELDELLSGYAMFPEMTADLVASRKRAQSSASGFLAPDTFQMSEGAYRPAEIQSRENPIFDEATELSGIAACGGRVTGRAAVLASLSDAHRLQAGDVLVTRQTDPGWAPVFSLIRGLIIERGGMLSHGAIIAREFGLPCVVGVKDAASRIPHGCTVSMDGDRGHVQILA